jgi:hypothetical protein
MAFDIYELIYEMSWSLDVVVRCSLLFLEAAED